MAGATNIRGCADFHQIALLTGMHRGSGTHIALLNQEKLAHPTRFERLTFAFGGQAPINPAVHRRRKSSGWAITWMSHDGFHEKIGGEAPVFRL
jgi:hypothetical protein